MATVHPRITVVRLSELVDRALAGRIRIPAFQRPFQWRSKDVLDLLQSVQDGYPIGEIVVLRGPAPADAVIIGPLEVDAPEVDDAWWIVDGHQRVASLVGALAASPDPGVGHREGG